MHESSLGGTLRDYLSGEEIEETTFEEFRQLLVRFLVEEKGYPKDRLKAKIPLTYSVDGEEFERSIDYVLYDGQDRPIFIIMFCAGNVTTFERETVCAARLVQGGPVPYALITDTMDASLMDVKTGDMVARSMGAVPDYDRLVAMVEASDMAPLNDEQREKQTRVFHAYCGFVSGCCGDSCPPSTDSEN